MGISGLLPFLEKASKRCHVAEFRGCTVAIDAYCWLHKGAFGCAEKIVKGEDTHSYVFYCMKYIKMLKSYDIHPILVFDGQHLPAKRLTEEKRREQRKISRKKASELLCIGKIEEARTQMRLSIDVTHKMALALIKECRKFGIDCIVAPYEADAQLAYLNTKKFVHFVITEDSDLLLFGCNKIFCKMDIQGFGTLVEADKINLCMKLKPDSYNFDKFRYMCILSGCDYLANLPGVGLKKALKFVSLTADPDIYNVLLKLPSYLKLSNIVVTEEYREAFMTADATFKHQLVFDPLERKLIPLQDLKHSNTKEEHCRNAGAMFDGSFAFEMALGNIDPLTHEKYDDWSPDMVPLPITSIWSKQYSKPKEPIKKTAKLVAPNTKNIQVNVGPSEQEKLEYDLKLKEELEIYKVIEHVPKRQKIEEIPMPVAPILDKVHMPFKNLKKISKFERTVVKYDETLTSRFFILEDSLPVQGPSTNSYDSLLSSINDYTKKRKSFENEKQELEGKNEIIPERSIKEDKEERHVTRLSNFEISKEVSLASIKFTAGDVQEALKSTFTNMESEEIENNINISNFIEKEKEHREIIYLEEKTEDGKDENVQLVNPESPVKSVRNVTYGEEEQEFESHTINENTLDQETDQNDFTICTEDEVNDIVEVDKGIKISKSKSPVLSSASKPLYRRERSPQKKTTSKNQMDLLTMFKNMEKN